MARNKKVTSNMQQVTRKLLISFGGGIIVLISLSIFSLWAKNEVATFLRTPVEREIKEWEEIVNKTPTYRDGYLKLATLYWRLHEDEKVKENLDIARHLDPNYEGTQTLKKELGY